MDAIVLTLLDAFVKNSGAETSKVEKMLLRGGISLPFEYWELLRYMNGGEGFVGDEYVRFYAAERLVSLNQAFGVNEFAPGLFIFGSNGGGTAWAYDLRTNPPNIVDVLFIPMDIKHMRYYGPSLKDFLEKLAQEYAGNSSHVPNQALIGKEIHEVQPIVFGGDSTDPKNKILLSPEKYAEYVVWWNRKYQTLIKKG